MRPNQPKNRRAAEAAEAYWRAAGGEGHHFGKTAGHLAASLQKAAASRARTSASNGVATSTRRSEVGSGGTLLPTRRNKGKRSPLYASIFLLSP